MGWIDVCLIIILAIFALVGFSKGFLSSLLSLFSWGITLALAIVVCKPVAAFIDKVTPLANAMSGWISQGLTSLSTALNVTYTEGTTVVSDIVAALPAGLKEIAKAIIEKGISSGAIVSGTTNIQTYLIGILTGVGMILAGVVVSFIVIKIIIFILSKIFNALTRNVAISGLDKLLGLVFGLAKGVLVVAILCVATYVVNLTPLSGAVTAQIAKNPITTQVYNTADKYIDEFVENQLKNIDLNELVAKWFGITSGTEDETPEVPEGSVVIGAIDYSAVQPLMITANITE